MLFVYFFLLVQVICPSNGFGLHCSPKRTASYAAHRKLSMVTLESSEISIPTKFGPMKSLLYTPSTPGKYPGIVFYSEIFQLTGPICRAAQYLAGHGFIVLVPEIYHNSSPGWVGEYTAEGADEGNRLKMATTVEQYDEDSRAALDFLNKHPSCTGKLGTAGFCIGGHLCLRAAMMNDNVRAVASWYPTDVHQGTGVCAGIKDKAQDTMNLFSTLPKKNNGDGVELCMIYGRQDRHVDDDGRRRTYDKLTEAGVHFQWLELNGMHAFMRDEGYRYDPQLQSMTWGIAMDLFNRKLHSGSLPSVGQLEKGTLNAKM